VKFSTVSTFSLNYTNRASNECTHIQICIHKCTILPPTCSYKCICTCTWAVKVEPCTINTCTTPPSVHMHTTTGKMVPNAKYSNHSWSLHPAPIYRTFITTLTDSYPAIAQSTAHLSKHRQVSPRGLPASDT
jgi:hypothetical protein